MERDIREVESERIQVPDTPVERVGEKPERPEVLVERELEVGERIAEAFNGLHTPENQVVVGIEACGERRQVDHRGNQGDCTACERGPFSPHWRPAEPSSVSSFAWPVRR